MSGMVLRRVENLSGGWQLQIGHYAPDGAWEVLEALPDGDRFFDRAVELLSRMNGGLERRDLFAAAVLPSLLLRDNDTEYSWLTKSAEHQRKLADRADELASEIEHVLGGAP